MPDTQAQPWRGVYVATALPFRHDGSVDLDAYGEHVRFLADGGCHGVCPNGSLGEYQTLSIDERTRVMRTAIEAAPEGFGVMPGVAAYGSREVCGWIERAAEAGAASVLLLPPNSYRASRSDVVAHYREAARVGLPVVAYNNPIDTKVDLTPDLLAELHAENLIVAVKEFSGDPRRAYLLAESAPGLDLIVGADDMVLELGLAGAVGWIAGYTNAFPATTVEMFRLITSDDPADVPAGIALYRSLHALLRWDSKTEFVQAIKLSMDMAGRYGGPCRPPRGPLPDDVAARITELTKAAIAEGCR
ncbi:dihydrodipicolinate synthase family protein [Streptomyces sp. NPDC008139]|uniref:dihydrodipicolinate synthase family protein n=1 Tax=Streptomyces sp. NPDC008139 TaxID=3364814 RepID=UPI0036F020E7